MENQDSFLDTKVTSDGASLATGGSPLPDLAVIRAGRKTVPLREKISTLQGKEIVFHKRRKGDCFIVSIIIHVILFAGLIFASSPRYSSRLSTPVVVFIKPEPIAMDMEERVNEMEVVPLTPEILPDVICIRLESTESSESRIIPQTSTSAQVKPKAEGRNRKPPYPELARRLGQEGLVILLVEVDVNGRVSDITLKQSSGYKLLDDAALLCVKSWLFNPATKNGKPVVSKIEIPIRYKLS